MKILIVGSGGREHALAWKCSLSPKVEKIYCAPGNAGIAQLAELVPLKPDQFDELADFAASNEIDLTIIGMDDPLAGGIVDVFEARGLRVFGPRKRAAILEASKAFSKDLMKKYGIPTASYETFTKLEEAKEYLKKLGKFPVVLKASGLALGKGVLICEDLESALAGADAIMGEKKFGQAGDEMVVEEFLTGREVSVLTFVDGRHLKEMSSAQDYKRAGDGDSGLNTGGMGNISPNPGYTEEIRKVCQETIFQPTVDAMRREGREFKGVIFFGLMLTEDGPKVLEYLPRMENDLIDVIEACIDGTLDQVELRFRKEICVCVVLASGGYPSSYEKGKEIHGLGAFNDKTDRFCFHAGTTEKDGKIVTNGGRVLGIAALGKDLEEARAKAYEAAGWVGFEGKYYRHDIAL